MLYVDLIVCYLLYSFLTLLIVYSIQYLFNNIISDMDPSNRSTSACPHVKDSANLCRLRYSMFNFPNTCGECTRKGLRSFPLNALWICLKCGHVGCGRNQNKHSLEHYNYNKKLLNCHSLAANVEKLSWIFCYECNKTINMENDRILIACISQLKSLPIRNSMSEKAEDFESVEGILSKLDIKDRSKLEGVLYGERCTLKSVPELVSKYALDYNWEALCCRFDAKAEQLRGSRIVRVGLFQHKTPLETWAPIEKQRTAMYQLAKQALLIANLGKVNIFCFQEAWNMPFAFCTREKHPWCEFAESARFGPTTKMLQELAKKYNMVIISSILERDEVHNDTIWNTSVVIDNHGDYLGKHRKNHIPRVGDFNESTYYFEGNTGHPVFDTEFGKIAINICYGRHHPLNWMMFGINGAEIVFNPSATVAGVSEPLWGIEARNAAIANGYFTCAINRVGTEVFKNEFTSADGNKAHTDFGHFYGSSYVAAPNGSRSPGLSRTKNGLLIAEMDLNLCRQVKDVWGFQMTQRLDMYADSFSKAIQPNYKPQVIRKK